MKKIILFSLSLFLMLLSCDKETDQHQEGHENSDSAIDLSKSREAILNAEGVQMIRIGTAIDSFNVYTRKVGSNPDMKVLLLHGGPGCTHELYESVEDYFPDKNIEFYYYDQLGSYYSDQPSDTSLWTVERFVDEVEQVRTALGLDSTNFYLLGQSWGGILAMEYALKHQENIKGLIISNMVSNIESYNAYNRDVLAPMLPADVLDTILHYEDLEDYMNETYLGLIQEHYYTEHVLRAPLDEWPDAINRTFKHLNPEVYVYMQGPSEFGIKGDASLKNWSVSDRLGEIYVPTLTVGGKHDTMDPNHMLWMAFQVQRGRFLMCYNGSHLSQYDDMDTYWNGVVRFVEDVNSGAF